MMVGVNLEDIDKKPQQSIWILKVLLDSKLHWGSYVKCTVEKAVQQYHTLTTTVRSTWEATFTKIQLIYSAVVYPSITYRVTIWAPTESLLWPAHWYWIGNALECKQ